MESAFLMEGAASIGSWHTQYASLWGGREALRLSGFGRDYIFTKENTLSLGTGRALSFAPGLRINHAIITYPKYVVFWVSSVPWTRRFTYLKEKLEDLGYEVR